MIHSHSSDHFDLLFTEVALIANPLTRPSRAQANAWAVNLRSKNPQGLVTQSNERPTDLVDTSYQAPYIRMGRPEVGSEQARKTFLRLCALVDAMTNLSLLKVER